MLPDAKTLSEKRVKRFKDAVQPLTLCRRYTPNHWGYQDIYDDDDPIWDTLTLIENETFGNTPYALRAISYRDTVEHLINVEMYQFLVNGRWMQYSMIVAEPQSNSIVDNDVEEDDEDE